MLKRFLDFFEEKKKSYFQIIYWKFSYFDSLLVQKNFRVEKSKQMKAREENFLF